MGISNQERRVRRGTRAGRSCVVCSRHGQLAPTEPTARGRDQIKTIITKESESVCGCARVVAAVHLPLSHVFHAHTIALVYTARLRTTPRIPGAPCTRCIDPERPVPARRKQLVLCWPEEPTEHEVATAVHRCHHERHGIEAPRRSAEAPDDPKRSV